tara:strand:+ start:655 stop:810 length:156 start_codon:yes stop_codon:yes gene_type:complete
MKPNWGIIAILLIGLLFWTSVFIYGIFKAVTILIICSAIAGLIIKLKENRY